MKRGRGNKSSKSGRDDVFDSKPSGNEVLKKPHGKKVDADGKYCQGRIDQAFIDDELNIKKFVF